jgi:hypothetical protein
MTMTRTNPSLPAPVSNSVTLASLMLPGLAALASLAPMAAVAEGAPEKTTIAIKYSSYEDGQPGWERVKVTAPSLYIQAPIASDWSIEASAVVDGVSGASPRWHTQNTQLSGASRMSDERKANDVKVTRYFARSAWSVGVASSSEHDYQSSAIGLDARWSTDNNNRTWTAGYGLSTDRIDNSYSGGDVLDKQKRTQEFMVGVTQVLTPGDIVQFNLTRSDGQGYYNDPYKTLDQRPDQRSSWIGLARWNHYVEPMDTALRTSYRYYSDTFGVQSHTLGVEWAQPVGRWTFTPAARYYSQSAANFYLDPILNDQGEYDQMAVFLRAIDRLGSNQSTDQRLAAFGALTWSLKAAYAITENTVVDVKYESYRQTAALHLGGAGSPGLDPFNATFWQLGLTHRF